MWRSVFLHDFLDTDIRNFKAIAGSPTATSLSLMPMRTSPIQGNSVLITPGRGFEYSFVEPLDEIIGVSGRVRLRYPIQGSGGTVRIMRVGEMAELRIRPLPGPPVDSSPLAHPTAALLRIE